MKKLLTICIVCVMCISSVFCADATNEKTEVQSGLVIAINGAETEYSSVVYNNTHYVPARKVFELLGAAVFYRGRDRQILVLSRDGDLIRHIVGESVVTYNGEQRTFLLPSVLENGTSYVPIDMVSSVFVLDGVSYENGRVDLQKYMFSNEYHLLIKDILELCKTENFYPEYFQRYIDYHGAKPDCSMQDVICAVNMGQDFPFYENVTTVSNPYTVSVLVNKNNKLPAGFSQQNLVDMEAGLTIRDGKHYQLLDVAYEHFVQMWEAAREEGLSLQVLSAYRTEDYQNWLYNDKLRKNGKVYADNYSARPGFSEHQTGLAVDIGFTKTAFENTAEFDWMQEHAHEYGYILRYPKGKEWLTGYAYEPWHYRYVGTDVARVVREEGITYEEYCAKYVSLSEFE